MYIGAFRMPNLDAAAARVTNVARALRMAGHEISFISWGGIQREEDLTAEGLYEIDGFPYVVTDELGFTGGTLSKIKGWLSRGNKTKKILEKEKCNFDAIITYNCSLLRWLLSFCRENKKFLICDLTEWYDNNEQRLVEKPGYYVKMNFIQPRIKNKIVISSYLDGYYNTSHNVIVPAMCDITENKWHKDVNVARSKVGDYDGITLIYAGNPARKDAVHYVIGAVQKLIKEGAKLRFLIIGITRDKYVEKYRDLLPVEELSDKIMFLGRVSQDDVPMYYRISDFMVLLREPNRKSQAGFPTKFSESFISGTPVIANITSDLGRYLKDGVTGFVVSEPNQESIYLTLKNRVLLMGREDIDKMKRNVNDNSKKLDYRYFVSLLSNFIDKLEQ